MELEETEATSAKERKGKGRKRKYIKDEKTGQVRWSSVRIRIQNVIKESLIFSENYI